MKNHLAYRIAHFSHRTLKKMIPPQYQRLYSYAQSGEDIIVSNLLNRLGILHPLYLDIGAHHPTHFNNTYLFYKQGSTGICVEPDGYFAHILKKYRPKDTILNVGVSADATTEADFYQLNPPTLSTFCAEDANQLAEAGIAQIKQIVKVPLLTINDIIENNCLRTPDYITIDVEGWNQAIIESFNFSRYRPPVFCIETITFAPDNSGSKIQAIFDVMRRNGYWVYGETHINTIFVDKNIHSENIMTT